MKLKPLLILFISGFLIAAARPSYPQEPGVKAEMKDDGTMVLTLSKEQVEHCKKSGGCSVVTGVYEEALVEEALKAGLQMCQGKGI
jgi:hypothetical protein